MEAHIIEQGEKAPNISSAPVTPIWLWSPARDKEICPHHLAAPVNETWLFCLLFYSGKKHTQKYHLHKETQKGRDTWEVAI